jgi:predicted nucleic acid-binding protein
MTTLVDSSVLLDILVSDPRFCDLSESALKTARSNGRLVVCEAVVAEIRPALSSDAELVEFCEDLGLDYEPCSFDAALLAGSMYAMYLTRTGMAKRVLPDFLIAAQARQNNYALLARDRGFYREYFDGIVVLDPSKAAM